MMATGKVLRFFCLGLWLNISWAKCPEPFGSKCHCGPVKFPKSDSPYQYLVNCTNQNFTDVGMLRKLPEETEVLIFTGNTLNELPINIFGENINHDSLTHINMSSNHITFIRGKTFHKVARVETLSLSFNNISLTGNHFRPRIFSNFRSLLNLYLTDAFTEDHNTSKSVLNLGNVFEESNLRNLQKLHMELNEMGLSGYNEKMFCSLTNLQHLHLGDSNLTDMDLKIDCLPHLNYLDLRSNMINRLSDGVMERLDEFQKKFPSEFRLSIRDNPFDCDCKAEKFIDWLRSTNVTLRSLNRYTCLHGYPEINIYKNLLDVTNISCPARTLPIVAGERSSVTLILLAVMIVFMYLVIVGVVIFHRTDFRTMFHRV